MSKYKIIRSSCRNDKIISDPEIVCICLNEGFANAVMHAFSETYKMRQLKNYPTCWMDEIGGWFYQVQEVK